MQINQNQVMQRTKDIEIKSWLDNDIGRMAMEETNCKVEAKTRCDLIGVEMI